MRFLTMFEMTVYLECRGREGEGREGGFAAFPSSFTQKASVILSAARDLSLVFFYPLASRHIFISY